MEIGASLAACRTDLLSLYNLKSMSGHSFLEPSVPASLKRRLLLLSNSRNPAKGYLEHALDPIRDLLGDRINSELWLDKSERTPTVLKIRYQGIRAMEGAGIYFVFTTHTCDLDLTVHVKNNDLDVFAEAYSPHKLAETDRHDPATGYYNWAIEKPLLAYQAVRVNWRRASVPVKQFSQLVAAPTPAAPPPNRSPEAPATST